MRTVKIRKSELEAKLTNNRAGHRALYEKAFAGYRDDMVKKLNEALDLINSGTRVSLRYNEEMPEDHTCDYDTVLNMLSMSTDEVVEITYQEFRQYVEDNWNWRESWTASNSKYYAGK